MPRIGMLRSAFLAGVVLYLSQYTQLLSRVYLINGRNSCFQQVLEALVRFHTSFVRIPTAETPLSTRITADPKYNKYFDGCIGALDGTHIAAHVPARLHVSFRDRTGLLSTNVLGCCDFDDCFVYVLPGWEGSAHDSKVLTNAINDYGFKTPEGCYWLVDAGYTNFDTSMVSYRGTRYHLKEQRQANL